MYGLLERAVADILKILLTVVIVCDLDYELSDLLENYFVNKFAVLKPLEA